jgi:hypothetical protein
MEAAGAAVLHHIQQGQFIMGMFRRYTFSVGLIAVSAVVGSTTAAMAQTPAAAAAVPAAVSASNAAAPPDGEGAQPARVSPPLFSRWVDLQVATFAGRYRMVENSAGVRTASQAQYQTSIKAAVRLDAAGRYLVSGSLGTGSTGTGSWNNTGIGTGSGLSDHFVKELFVTAAPVKGFSLQVGSMPFVRGQSSEAIGYDNDLYLMGERVVVKRPGELYFDEVSATFGYVGDLDTPSVFKRIDRLDESNYRQVLVGKKLGAALQASADYTSHDDVGTVRAAVTLNLPALRLVDWMRFEAYRGVDGAKPSGFAAHAEKRLAGGVSVGGGFADIDPLYGALNGDRFGKGKKVYGTGSLALPADFALQVWVARGVATDFAVSNHTRVDAVLSYNLMSTLKRARVF